jgi:hypothetical protein
MKFLVLCFLILHSLNTWASDSTWLLCENGHFAANLVEHRSHDGRGRVTSINLFLGMNLFTGELHDSESGHVFLPSFSKNRDGFTGDVSIDFTKNTFHIKGILRLEDDRYEVNSELACKEMTVDL